MKPRIFFLLSLVAFAPAWADDFKFKADDSVVFVGNTVIERAQKYGYVETALSLAAGDMPLRFRNWSGDTVYCDARSYFGPPQEGFDRLKAGLTEIKPSVLIVCYGAVAAFEGEAGVENFTAGYNRLLDMMAAAAESRAIILVSPPPAQNLGAPLPSMDEHNQRLSSYRDIIKGIAEKRGHQFADLFEAMGAGKVGDREQILTDNGLHYTEEGYKVLGQKLAESIGLAPPSDQQLLSESGVALRQMIVTKNLLYFQHWRPSNETYLRLFRKHEQGNNAKELELFTPLIESRETEIGALKRAALEAKS
jgi:hypothetical protein